MYKGLLIVLDFSIATQVNRTRQAIARVTTYLDMSNIVRLIIPENMI